MGGVARLMRRRRSGVGGGGRGAVAAGGGHVGRRVGACARNEPGSRQEALLVGVESAAAEDHADDREPQQDGRRGRALVMDRRGARRRSAGSARQRGRRRGGDPRRRGERRDRPRGGGFYAYKKGLL